MPRPFEKIDLRKTAWMLISAMLCLLAVLMACPQQAEAKTFILGDSRGCWLYNTLYSGYDSEIYAFQRGGDEIWKARICMGSIWFDSVCAPYVDKNVEPGDDIIICLGVNDMWNAADYAKTVNLNAAKWQRAGANTYFVSLNAVDDVTSEAMHFYQRDAETKRFNAQIQQMLDPGVVTYIDTRSRFDSGTVPYHTNDGLHYDDNTGIIVYDMVYDALSGNHPEPMSFPVSPYGSTDREIALFVFSILLAMTVAWIIAGMRRESALS